MFTNCRKEECWDCRVPACPFFRGGNHLKPSTCKDRDCGICPMKDCKFKEDDYGAIISKGSQRQSERS